ncbi:DUF4276 family protein [Desulfobotulus mexicanus]|uniref:DUF4276 family protein n=1 Tax=Desulfobotulus mexicanus TaxID=2586642 RepID=A0A5Q4VEA1_9BACT|nr:DUF4276 family protein [Desulfobotulus mexicanus]TYT76029.1 DUF4276 family protein [Desulfobotulus mexicanus]
MGVMPFYLATEDPISQALVIQVVEQTGTGPFVFEALKTSGFGHLKKNLPALIRLAAHCPVFLLTDLDQKPCAPFLIQQWLGENPLPEKFLFRVAVREVESWLLADRKGMADFMGAPLEQVPANPDFLADPKETVLKIARRYASRAVWQDIVPAKGVRAKVGVGYNQRLMAFVQESWSLERAVIHSESLGRAHQRLQVMLQKLEV